jgi:hypothetical protein
MRLTGYLVIAACLFTGAASLRADPIVPAGLQPGDHYHIAFVTSFTTGIVADTSVPPPFYPDFGGIAAADYIIEDTAAAVGYVPGWSFSDVTWKAILSTTTVSARDHVNVQGPVYNTRGELVATGAADLWDGTIAHAIQYDEGGGDIFSDFAVFTGSSGVGGVTAGPCGSNWNNPAGSCFVGNLTATDAHWLINAGSFCNVTARLYGISPLLTVPLPGDFNGDGVTDAADYDIWRKSNGTATNYDLWRSHFGQSITGSGASVESATVPEPSSLVLFVIVVVSLLQMQDRENRWCRRPAGLQTLRVWGEGGNLVPVVSSP